MKPLRLFLASTPDETLRQELENFSRFHAPLSAQSSRRIRWVVPEQWHLTWLFLGDVSPDAVADIDQRLQASLINLPPLYARLMAPAVWPNPRKARTLVWPVENTPELNRVCETIRQSLPDFPADKPFKPHVTIAWLKEKRGQKPEPFRLPEDLRFHPGGWEIRQVELVQSTLTPEGPIYRILKTYPPD